MLGTVLEVKTLKGNEDMHFHEFMESLSILYDLEQQFSTGVLQEFLKHVVPDY